MSLQCGHAFDECRIARRVADSPSGHGVGLGKAIGDDTALLYLIGNNIKIMLAGKDSKLCERFLRVDGPGRVIRPPRGF